MRYLLAVLFWLVTQCGNVQAAGLRELAPREAPAIELVALDGGRHRLSDLRGKVVLVNFWATWCPPCRAEMPSLARLSERMAGKSFAILGVDMGDTAEEVKAFLKEMPVPFPTLMDEDGATLKRWNVIGFPSTFLVDAKGALRYGITGAIEWDAPEAVEAIEKLLQEAGHTK
jgi:DsbE subfamily thiol:disulfide oxidoreductase